MFGNLFEEDEGGEEEERGGPGASSPPSRAAEEPPPPRGATGLCGIKNQGGTCYLNSLLQTLLFSPEFREQLFSVGSEELGSLDHLNQEGAKVRVIPLQLQRLFARLLLVDEQSASTSDLTLSFGWNSNEGTNQHDVQELNRILFSALERSLVGTSGSAFIDRLYHGTIVNSVVCRECGTVSQRQEDFLDLTVCVSGVSSLEEALWNMFVEEELFEGNNLYRCAQCDRLVTAAKSAKLRKLPPFMTMSLLRFSFDFAKCERYKETGRYSFPRTIDLRPFCEQSEGDGMEFSYELFSVIIHKGGCYGGHYHAYIKDIDKLGQWEPPDDDCKVKIQKKAKQELQEAWKQTLNKDDPLSVLTAIIAQEPTKSVLLDQLGQKLMDRIGSSWSKKFRKHYGPIGKFLQSHNDVFLLVSNGTRVALKANPPGPASEAGAPAAPPAARDPSAAAAATLPDSPESPDAEPEGSHWFDLNDSMVTPIREADIDKQFQGKESAYMLFYRKTQLHRPSQALHCPQYKVPHHLIQMAEEANLKLQQMREECEASNNSVELRLHLASSYTLRNGALQPLSLEHQPGIGFTFDGRKTLGELRLAIYQDQEQWEGDMALTVAKALPAGLHLYNTLTDDSLSVHGAGLSSNSQLFVWNGREVCGASVLTGAEWEPVLLTVVRPYVAEEGEGAACEGEGEGSAREEESSGGSGGGPAASGGLGLLKEARGFASAATLGEVREALGQTEQSLLCQEQGGGAGAATDGGGASGWRVFPPADMQRTLRELSLKDGDAVLVLEPQALDCSVFTRSGDLVTVTTPSDCRWLQVEYGLPGGDEGEERRRIKVPAVGNMLLCEVKHRALEAFQLQEQAPAAHYCLRQMDCTGKLLAPVCEELSVREAGVRLMTTLSLCEGTAPKAWQLFLHFCVGTAPSAGMEMDIIVEKTSTVKECLKAMLHAVGLEGSLWHLRRLDWCEEVGEALMDEDASLLELKIANGETLVVSEGQLPPKGFVQLCVWLQLDANSSALWVENGALKATQQVEGGERDAVGQLRRMGQVEISEEASLEDLKAQRNPGEKGVKGVKVNSPPPPGDLDPLSSLWSPQMLTLPALQDVCVPSPCFLRVWQLEGQRRSRLLRGPQLTLRKLKLSSGAEICVQLLLKEEDLGPKELLLSVKMGVPGERSYFPPEELVWDACAEASAGSLRCRLAAHYDLCPDSLLLAKHNPHKGTWEEISNWNQQVSRKKKKKKTESLLGAPFHLKDGDIIGVKNLLIDNNRDFSTLEDEQRLREHTQQQLQQQQPGKGDAEKKSCTTKSRKPEMGLSIDVGLFR